MAKDDVLRGLKRCKRLAKQDLLASSLTTDPQFWNEQAEARRKLYSEMMEVVENNGVEHAYRIALRERAVLPRFVSDDPQTTGRQQGIAMFLSILGVGQSDVPEVAREATLQGKVDDDTLLSNTL